jgi:hypothetical protein
MTSVKRSKQSLVLLSFVVMCPGDPSMTRSSEFSKEVRYLNFMVNFLNFKISLEYYMCPRKHACSRMQSGIPARECVTQAFVI